MGNLTQAAQNVVQNRRLAAIDADNKAWAEEQRGRIRQDWARQDQQNATMNEANAAGAKAFDGRRAQWILDGNDPQGFKPTGDDVLSGLDARGKVFMAKGDMDGYMKNQASAIGLRTQLRNQSIQQSMGNGDWAGVIKSLNKYTDNGFDNVDVQPGMSPDGKTQGYSITFSNNDGGQSQPVFASVDDIKQKVAMVMAKPEDIGRKELEMALNRYKADQAIRQKQAGEGEERQTARVKSGLRLGEISAQGEQSRRTEATRGAQDRQTQRQKPLVLSEGATAFGQEDTGDGMKLVPIAKGEPKSGKSLSAKDLNSMVISNFGVADMTGRPAGTDATAKISAAAEMLMRNNPGMGANEAIVKAAKDLNLQIQKK